MAIYAVEDLDDALAATRELLLPFDRTRWLKLAVVVFFVGGTAGTTTPQFNVSMGSGEPGVPAGPFEPDPEFYLVVATVAVLALVLALGFLLVASVMEFVFVESLRTRTVAIRRYWGDHWRKGVRLWGFRVGLGLLALGSFAVVAGVALVPASAGVGGLSVLALLLVVPAVVVLGVLLAVVNAFTTVFVVPVMLLEGGGVLRGWRRFWPTLTGNWVQFLAYVVVAFLLSLVGGILVSFVTAVLAVLLLIPFGVLGAVGVALFTVVELLGVLVVALAAVLFALSVVLVLALVQVPVQTYLRYFALLVLGDANAEFDLLPDLRETVRGSEAEVGS